MRFEIRSEGKRVDIAEEGFDWGVWVAELVSEEMIAIPIGPDQQHIVAPPACLDNSRPLKVRRISLCSTAFSIA